MMRRAIVPLITLLLGIFIGGYLFRDVRPRSFLAYDRCVACMSSAELSGLISSVGLKIIGHELPEIVLETDKTLVIKHPKPEASIHYVIIPKKDIPAIGEATVEDLPYLDDMFMIIAGLVQEQNLHHYRLITNGPGLQDVNYLHIHLRAES